MSTNIYTNVATNRIITIVGARPQFIKAAVVSRALERCDRALGGGEIREIVVHTGQHFDVNMSDVFFSEMRIATPAYHLGIGGGPHGAMTGRMMEAIERVVLEEAPHLVLVYGDTNSTLAGALAAAKLHVPVAHVEAGLRSFNRLMPEEINRVVTDHVSEMLFAPTDTAVANLSREGISHERIRQVGDVMYDAALHYGAEAEVRSTILEALGLEPNGYLLATCHRAENTDDPVRLRAIFEGISAVAADHPVVLPLHPRTRDALTSAGLDGAGRLRGLRLIDPVGYLDMVMLEKHARLIVTDSGGVQKEAFFHHVPCVTLREETEWVELLELGWNTLAPPTSSGRVEGAVRERLAALPTRADSPYGEGDSADRVASALVELLYP
jgi:UDP-GlcNAc3NAcA epimerase